jgi:NAD dependent epimerase/dehydratase family enzyme
MGKEHSAGRSTALPLRVVPRRALDKGYTFRYPELEPALRDLLGR